MPSGRGWRPTRRSFRIAGTPMVRPAPAIGLRDLLLIVLASVLLAGAAYLALEILAAVAAERVGAADKRPVLRGELERKPR